MTMTFYDNRRPVRYILGIRNWRTGIYRPANISRWLFSDNYVVFSPGEVNRRDYYHWSISRYPFKDARIYTFNFRDQGRPAPFKWLRYQDPLWRNRETHAFYDGTYRRLPAFLVPISDHYAHLAISEGTIMIRFTLSESNGKMDIKTLMKVGRYLAKYYPHLSPEEINRATCDIDNLLTPKFAMTPEEIERVYLNGPPSCMSYPAGKYHSEGIHPTRVYGAGDLAVAYLSDLPITDSRFKVSARALCWPARKLYGRIYGDRLRMKSALEKLGYQEDALAGAKLLKIELPRQGGFVMPFIDGLKTVSYHKTHFSIGEGLNAETAEGVIPDWRSKCSLCLKRVDSDERIIKRSAAYHSNCWAQYEQRI